MDIKRLTHFIALAEEGRFSLAAARVNLSQAAFSRSIQALEESAGMRLFDRGAKGARLTAAGEFYLVKARSLSSDIQCLQRDMALMKSGDVGELAVGTGPAPAAVIVPGMLCALRKQCPALVVRVSMGKLPQLLLQLDAQKLDFCLGDVRMIRNSERYGIALVGKIYGALYCRKGHPLLRRASVTFDDLNQYRIACVSLSPLLASTVLDTHGFPSGSTFPLAVECDDAATLTHLVTHTDVIGLLPPHLADANMKIRKLKTPNAQEPFAEVSAFWLKGRTLAPSALRAIQIAKKVLNPTAPF